MESVFANLYEYFVSLYKKAEAIDKDILWSNYKGARMLLEKSEIVNNFRPLSVITDAIDYLRSKECRDSSRVLLELISLTQEYYKYIGDEVIILGAYEQYAKSLLLEKNVVVHRITSPSELAGKQNETPIIYTDIDMSKNTIREETIGLATLFREQYQRVIGTDPETLKVLKEMRAIRNLIHFDDFSPIDINKQKVEIVQKLYNEIKLKEEIYSNHQI